MAARPPRPARRGLRAGVPGGTPPLRGPAGRRPRVPASADRRRAGPPTPRAAATRPLPSRTHRATTPRRSRAADPRRGDRRGPPNGGGRGPVAPRSGGGRGEGCTLASRARGRQDVVEERGPSRSGPVPAHLSVAHPHRIPPRVGPWEADQAQQRQHGPKGEGDRPQGSGRTLAHRQRPRDARGGDEEEEPREVVSGEDQHSEGGHEDDEHVDVVTGEQPPPDPRHQHDGQRHRQQLDEQSRQLVLPWAGDHAGQPPQLESGIPPWVGVRAARPGSAGHRQVGRWRGTSVHWLHNRQGNRRLLAGQGASPDRRYSPRTRASRPGPIR